MSITLQSSYQLLDGMLEEGLPYVASYLQRLINHPIIITDHTGFIHYPEMLQNNGDEFISIKLSSKNEVSYHELDQSLYYPILHNEILALVIVKGVSPNCVSKIITILSTAQLALKSYFVDLNRKNKGADNFEKLMSDYLSQKADTNIKHIIQKSHGVLDTEMQYFIVTIKIDKEGIRDFKSISAFSKQYFNRTQSEVIILTCSECFILIVPTNSEDQALITSSSEQFLKTLTKYKEIIENKFEETFSFGIGQIYPVLSIRESFKEAQIALTLNMLMEKKSFIQEFKQLGIYYFIFSRDIESIKNYCFNILGPLIYYDKATNSDLLNTLRKVLNYNYNFKSAADDLFIHINTVRYRASRIEQLLNIDLSEYYARIDLYAAIKVWDTLEIHSFFKGL